MNRFAVLLLLTTLQLQAQQPFSFEAAMETALENSPDIIQARYRLEQNEELLNAQNAMLKSRFSLNLNPFSFDRSREFNTDLSSFVSRETREASGTLSIRQPIKATDGTLTLSNQVSWLDATSSFQESETRAFSNNLFLTYQQGLFTYNRTKLDLRGVELDLENAQLNYRIQELLLEQQVAQSFYNAFQQKSSLQISEEEYQNTLTSYEIINNKVEAGLVAREELLQAELNLASSQSSVQNNKVSLQDALDDFKQLIGIPITEDITIVAQIEQDPVGVSMEKAVEHALASRMELRQRKIDIETARQSLTTASATNEFRGDLSMSYGLIGNNEEFGQIYDEQSRTQSQSFTVSLEIPLWDWGEKASRTKAAEISVASSEISLEQEREGIVIQIRKGYRNLENQIVQVEIARKNVEVAQQTYDINLERYANGDLTSMDLNQFQIQLSEKKIGLVNALINYKLALLDMKIQSLWDFEKNLPVLFN